MSNVSKELQDSLAALATDLNESRGYPIAGYMDSDTLPSTDLRIKTGCSVLDKMLNGGYPAGRVIELFGFESSGKSTIIDHALIECQKMGGIAVKIDQEHSHHKDRFERMGGDSSSLLVLRPLTLEDGIVDWISTTKRIKEIKDEGLLEPEAPILVAWDTIHAAPPASLVEGIEEGDYYGGGMAIKARVLQDMFRFSTIFIPHHNVCLIIANQLTSTIGGYGPSTTTSGGNALKFYSSIRLSIKNGGPYYEGDEDVGISSNVTVVKNKVDPPVGECSIPIRYDTGIDNVTSAFWYLVEKELIVRRGAWYNLGYNDQLYKFYEKNFISTVTENIPDYDRVLEDMVNKPMNWDMGEDGNYYYMDDTLVEDTQTSDN